MFSLFYLLSVLIKQHQTLSFFNKNSIKLVHSHCFYRKNPQQDFSMFHSYKPLSDILAPQFEKFKLKILIDYAIYSKIVYFFYPTFLQFCWYNLVCLSHWLLFQFYFLNEKFFLKLHLLHKPLCLLFLPYFQC